MTSDPRLSPDATQVAWVLISQDRETDTPQSRIQVGPVAGGGSRDFTSGPRDTSPRWSPDGSQLAFLRGSEDGPAQVFLASLAGGDPRKVTDLPGGASDLSWSPDGTRLAFVSRVGVPKPAKDKTPAERNEPRVVTRLNGRLDGLGWKEGRAHVFTLDVAGGDVRQLTDGDWDDVQPAWSPEGSTLVFVSDRSRKRHLNILRAEIFSVPAKGGRARKLTNTGGGAAFPTYSPDGRWIAFTGDNAGDEFWNEQSGLWRIPSDGSEEPQQLAAKLDREIGNFFSPSAPLAWLPDSKRIVTIAAERGTVRVCEIDTTTDRVTPVVKGDQMVDSLSLSNDGKMLAYSASWLTQPHEIYVTTLGGRGRARTVSCANEEARMTLRFPEVRRVSHTSPDGYAIEAFLCLPANASGKLPLVLDVHGGPHAAHPLPNVGLPAAVLTGQGFAVLFPNPRGSSSYGREFMQASHQDWGGRDYDDLMGSVDAVVEAGIADPKRLYVQGYSYGGFMTAWIIGHTDRFRAAAVGAPVIDLVSMEGTSDIPGFITHEFTGPAWESPELLRKHSPLTYLSKVKTPTLINHFEGDLRCPIGQADQLFHALLSRGVDSVFVRYPGGAHGVRMPSQVADRLQRISDWFSSH